MSAAAGIPAKLDINRVIRRAAEVLQRNWRSLLRPALFYLYLPGALTGFVRPTDGDTAVRAAGAGLLTLLATLLVLFLYALIQGGLYRLTVADLKAEPISTDEAIKLGRDRMWAMVGLNLLAGIGIALGFVLLIVPGVLLALAWSVVGPVLIEERRPVMETFRRSAELTRDNRLHIFGLALLMLVAAILAALPIGLLSAPFPARLADTLIQPIYTVVVAVVGAVVVAVIYDELKTQKEGAADVFS